MIKERRFGGLIVANDPRIASTDDTLSRKNSNPSVSSPDETAEIDGTPLAEKAGSSTHSSTLSSKRSTSLFSSARKSGSRTSDEQQPRTGPRVEELRAEAQLITASPIPITVLDVDELTDQTAAWLMMDQADAPAPRTVSGNSALPDLPDFGSDDSDGPPSYHEDFE